MLMYRLNGQEVVAIDGELKAVENEIDRLERERGNLLPRIQGADDENKKKLQAEYDRLSRQIELQDIKFERLKQEFLDVDAELKALD